MMQLMEKMSRFFLVTVLIALSACFDVAGLSTSYGDGGADAAVRMDGGADAVVAPLPDLACAGVVLNGGTCFFNYCPDGYVWTFDEAAAQCAALGARLCSLDEVRGALAAGYDSCCVAWTATSCGDGKTAVGYAHASPSDPGCTSGVNDSCRVPTTPAGANCCR